jgi:Ras-related GTP-binding protein C/D
MRSSTVPTDTLQGLRDRLTEELFDMSPDLESSMNVFYHLTSVFDTSIYEALSKVIQKLIPEQAMLERLLDLLCEVGSAFSTHLQAEVS